MKNKFLCVFIVCDFDICRICAGICHRPTFATVVEKNILIFTTFAQRNKIAENEMFCSVSFNPLTSCLEGGKVAKIAFLFLDI